MARRTPDDIVAIERGFERNRIEEVLGELGAKLLQLGQGKRVQLASALEPQPHRIADDLMRLAEGNSLAREIGRGGHGVEVTGRSGGREFLLPEAQ